MSVTRTWRAYTTEVRRSIEQTDDNCSVHFQRRVNEFYSVHTATTFVGSSTPKSPSYPPIRFYVARAVKPNIDEAGVASARNDRV